MVENYLKEDFFCKPGVRQELARIRDRVLEGTMLPTVAAERLLAHGVGGHLVGREKQG